MYLIHLTADQGRQFVFSEPECHPHPRKRVRSGPKEGLPFRQSVSLMYRNNHSHRFAVPLNFNSASSSYIFRQPGTEFPDAHHVW